MKERARKSKLTLKKERKKQTVKLVDLAGTNLGNKERQVRGGGTSNTFTQMSNDLGPDNIQKKN